VLRTDVDQSSQLRTDSGPNVCVNFGHLWEGLPVGLAKWRYCFILYSRPTPPSDVLSGPIQHRSSRATNIISQSKNIYLSWDTKKETRDAELSRRNMELYDFSSRENALFWNFSDQELISNR